MQVEESFRKYAEARASSTSSPVYGGVPLEPQEKKLRAGVDVVVATPGRLIDHLERQNVVFDDLEVLVLDEADRMLDMGFAPQINRIVDEMPTYRQTLLFSATMPPEVEALARKYLRKPVVVQVGRALGGREHGDARGVSGAARARRTRCSWSCSRSKGTTRCSSSRAPSTAPTASCAIWRRPGIAATAMHADKSQAQRTRALEDFKDGKIRVLVATDIAQRGLDISRHHARHQLRRAAAGRGLRAPHRPHGARGEGRATRTPSWRPTRSRWCARSSA